jgi:hypothetical protein
MAVAEIMWGIPIGLIWRSVGVLLIVALTSWGIHAYNIKVSAMPTIASNPIVQKCKSPLKTSKKKPVDAAKIEVAKVMPAVVLPEQKQAVPINDADYDLSLKPPAPPFPPN